MDISASQGQLACMVGNSIILTPSLFHCPSPPQLGGFLRCKLFDVSLVAEEILLELMTATDLSNVLGAYEKLRSRKKKKKNRLHRVSGAILIRRSDPQCLGSVNSSVCSA